MIDMKIKTISIIAFILFVQCATVNDEYSECEDRIVLTTLNNEPARILKDPYGHFCEGDSFIVLLLNQRDEPPYYFRTVYPIGGVPEAFRLDHLYVLISGDILHCEKNSECDPPSSNTKNQVTNMLDLKTIKTNDINTPEEILGKWGLVKAAWPRGYSITYPTVEVIFEFKPKNILTVQCLRQDNACAWNASDYAYFFYPLDSANKTMVRIGNGSFWYHISERKLKIGLGPADGVNYYFERM